MELEEVFVYPIIMRKRKQKSPTSYERIGEEFFYYIITTFVIEVCEFIIGKSA